MTIPRHIMRYGAHPEKNFFVDPYDKLYDCALLSANTVAYSTRGIAEFLTQYLKKPFIIDPLTHAFGHNPIHIAKDRDDPSPKPALKTLAEFYGNTIKSVLGKRGVQPDDFSASRDVEDFCLRVLTFQKSIIINQIKENDEDKYIAYTHQTPCMIIAPYFYMNSVTFDYWFDVNMQFIDQSCLLEDKIPVFGYILISKEAFFDTVLNKKLIEELTIRKCEGFLLWIESFSEREATESELRVYKDFVVELNKKGKKLISLYGGYFSILLQKVGLYGVTHGPGYGEDRDVTPVGGGLPKPKFYFPALHDRLPFREVLFAMQQRAQWTTARQYYDNVCQCECCKETIKDDIANFKKFGESKAGIRRDGISFEYQTTQAKVLTTTHYLLNKDSEFKFVEHNSLQDLRQNLIETRSNYKDKFELDRIGHLNIWQKALS